jgi:hypothetical protein
MIHPVLTGPRLSTYDSPRQPRTLGPYLKLHSGPIVYSKDLWSYQGIHCHAMVHSDDVGLSMDLHSDLMVYPKDLRSYQGLPIHHMV